MSRDNLPVEYRAGLAASTDAIRSVWKFGHQSAVATTEIAIWDVAAAYAYLGAATVLKVSSSDANDALAGPGTGAQTVKLYGLDANYAEIEETVSLTGQTEALTTASFLRIYRMKILSAGSGGVNAGVIYAGTGTVTSGVPANKYAAIAIGENQTLMAIYTVPAGHTALLRSVFVTGDSSKTVTAWLKMRPFGAVFQTKDKFLISQGAIQVNHVLPVKVAEKTDIEIRGKVSVGTTEVSGGIELLLVAGT